MSAPIGAQGDYPRRADRGCRVRGDLKVTLNFKEPDTDGGSAITGYEYRYKSGATAIRLGGSRFRPNNSMSPASGPYPIVLGLLNGTEYTFQARAVNSQGGGTPTSEITATPQPNNPATRGDSHELLSQRPRSSLCASRSGTRVRTPPTVMSAASCLPTGVFVEAPLRTPATNDSVECGVRLRGQEPTDAANGAPIAAQALRLADRGML